MSSNDPIRLSDFREAQAASPAISRQEAERQFKLSFALVTVLVLGTMVAIATLPRSGGDGSDGQPLHVASQTMVR